MTDCFTKRRISHDEAREVAQRLINSHFRKEPCARVGIPARPDYDDDLLITAYIRQQAAADVAEAKADAAALDVSALAQGDDPYFGERLPAGTPIADGFTLTGRAEPIGAERPWEPMQSATLLPHGYQQRGSTGQLFEVRNGGWVRVIENPPRPA